MLPWSWSRSIELGASPERLEEWYEAYRAKSGLIRVPDPVAPIDARTWEAALGDRAREADYRNFFASEVGRLASPAPSRPTCRASFRAWPQRTHPLMRLAYGILEQDQREVGIALAYWAACYLPLPAATGSDPWTEDPAEVLAAVGAIEGVHDYEPESDLLWHNIRAVGALPGFRPVVDWLAFGPDSPAAWPRHRLRFFGDNGLRGGARCDRPPLGAARLALLGGEGAALSRLLAGHRVTRAEDRLSEHPLARRVGAYAPPGSASVVGDQGGRDPVG